jgi:hypothetical protein
VATSGVAIAAVIEAVVGVVESEEGAADGMKSLRAGKERRW